MTTVPQASTIRCVKCGAEFGCDPAGDCWCKDESFRLPMPTSDVESCLCPKCLCAAAKTKS